MLRKSAVELERLRAWPSDTNDPLERQAIQLWTGLLLPPELIGAHAGAPKAHSTGRTHSMAFRAGTALFGHFGVELDLTTTADDERAELGEWLALYRRFRPLIHSGRVVRSDNPDPSMALYGVVAGDGSEALYAIVGRQTPVTQPPGRIRLPGLAPHAVYRFALLKPGHVPTATRRLPPWLEAAAPGARGVMLSGRLLDTAGLQAPFMHPESLLLVHLTRTTLHPVPVEEARPDIPVI